MVRGDSWAASGLRKTGKRHDGLELTQMIREHDQQSPILIYTSRGAADNEIAVLDAGADQFINKERSLVILTAYMKRIREKIKASMNIPYLYLLSSYTTCNSITRTLTINGQNIRLKGVEGRFLQLLCAKNNEVASKRYLIHGILYRTQKVDTEKIPLKQLLQGD